MEKKTDNYYYKCLGVSKGFSDEIDMYVHILGVLGLRGRIMESRMEKRWKMKWKHVGCPLAGF